MIFDKEGTTTTVFQEKTTIATFFANFSKVYSQLEHDNIIVNLFSFDNLTSGDILEFLQFSQRHKESGKSFVLVSNKISFDELPDDITVVPTLQEAKDIIEMEEIERDLGI